MHKWDRQQVILRRLRAGGFVGLAELAALTEASSATLRRDVARLAVAGQLRRVHGGVRSPDMDHAPQVGSRAIGIRVGLHAAEKRRLARAETKLLSRAEALVVIADASKFEARGSMVVCPLQRVHTLITGASAPADVLDHIRSAGVTVVTIGDDAVPPEEALAAVEM